MEPRIYHGDISPQDFAAALISHFNRGNLHAQQFGAGEKIAVQIATRAIPTSGGQTALTISLQKVADGVAIQIGQQAWLGVAASLGMTALTRGATHGRCSHDWMIWRRILNIFKSMNRHGKLSMPPPSEPALPLSCRSNSVDWFVLTVMQPTLSVKAIASPAVRRSASLNHVPVRDAVS